MILSVVTRGQRVHVRKPEFFMNDVCEGQGRNEGHIFCIDPFSVNSPVIPLGNLGISILRK